MERGGDIVKKLVGGGGVGGRGFEKGGGRERVSTGVKVKRGVTGGSLYRVVVSELDRCEVKVPVRMPGVDVGSEGFLDDPVDALGLTVGLGVEGGGEGEFGTK